jgi:ABC-type branched-subunit amino acid transport system ATPase component
MRAPVRILLVEHDVALAGVVCGQIFVLHFGRTINVGCSAAALLARS